MNCQKLFVLLFSVVLVIFAGCSDSVTSDENSKASIKQVGGCTSAAFKKDAGQTDSCFSYEFHNDLKVQFCAPGNCCPDSNRFTGEYRISTDTIVVTIEDTAANLCKCMCNYNIRAELEGLLLNRYLFKVEKQDSSYRQTLYSEYIYKD
ncbi:MAG: hypothetical protein AB1521_16485 [Bacteroidota bacterium]